MHRNGGEKKLSNGKTGFFWWFPYVPFCSSNSRISPKMLRCPPAKTFWLLISHFPKKSSFLPMSSRKSIGNLPKTRILALQTARSVTNGLHLGWISCQSRPVLVINFEPQWRGCGARSWPRPYRNMRCVTTCATWRDQNMLPQICINMGCSKNGAVRVSPPTKTSFLGESGSIFRVHLSLGWCKLQGIPRSVWNSARDRSLSPLWKSARTSGNRIFQSQLSDGLMSGFCATRCSWLMVSCDKKTPRGRSCDHANHTTKERMLDSCSDSLREVTNREPWDPMLYSYSMKDYNLGKQRVYTWI